MAVLRRTLLGSLCIPLLSGCTDDAAETDRDRARIDDPDQAFEVASAAIDRNVGPDLGSVTGSDVVAVRITSAEEAWGLHGDAAPRRSFLGQFVEETAFPTEQLVQIEVVRPNPHYYVEIDELSLEDSVGRFSVELRRDDSQEGEAPAVASFGRKLIRATVDAAGIESFEVEYGGETASPTPATEWL